MNWDDLRFFVTVARQGSVLGAAGELGVNQSTVSRRVVALEESLSVRLFERLRSGYSLTDAGHDLLKLAEGMAATADQIELQLLGRDTQMGGTVRVTGPDHVLGLLVHDLREFNRKHPEIVLEVVGSNAILDLSRRQSDVALRFTRRPSESLVGRRVATVGLGVYASRDYLERADLRKPESLTWVGEDDDNPCPDWLAATCPKARLSMRFNDVNGTYAALKAGVGLGRLPCWSGDLDPDLRRVGPLVGSGDFGVWLLTNENLRSTARVRAFLDHMAEVLRERRDLIEGKQPLHAPLNLAG